MGYSHYWTFQRSGLPHGELAERYQRAVVEIKHLRKRLPKNIVVAGPLGEGRPKLINELVCFNGDSSKNLDHETFCVPLTKDANSFSNDPDWDFCKTARKPYDLLVCASLLSFSRALPSVFTFESDGNIYGEDWAEATEFYRRNSL